MIGASFVDEMDCGSFFDQIDDLLDFSGEDLVAGAGADKDFPAIWSAPSDSFPGAEPVFCGNSNSDLSAELSVPYEDIVQLEWLSNFVEDSFSGGSSSLTISNKQDHVFNKDSSLSSLTSPSSSSTLNQFRVSSPVSVLDSSSSSSCSGKNTVTRSPECLTVARCGRARSKRPRPPTFSPRPGIQILSPASSITETTTPAIFVPCKSESENYAESRPPTKEAASEQPKKKMKKKIRFSFPREMNQGSLSAQGVRKCLHCEVTKTPQWRAGPLGPKTLCNACGVRFKSGRLFPEYRPAASPTFVPCLHSNSHKKVIEMRTNHKHGDKTGMIRGTTSPVELPELIPNTNCGISVDCL